MTKRYKYYRNSQMIYDNLTGDRFQGNKKTCEELNKLSNKSDKYVELLYPYEYLMRKYGIKSVGELDRILNKYKYEENTTNK